LRKISSTQLTLCGNIETYVMRQRHLLSPSLFNIILEVVVNVREKGTVKVG
jgi:hypothetical protein